MKVLVTGGTGFIGKHLVKTLVSCNHQVWVLTRRREGKNLIEKLEAKALVGGFEDIKFLEKILSKVDICYHLAAIRGDWGYSWKEYYENNIEVTKNLLTAALGWKGHFIFVSTVKAAHPTSFYAKSKLEAEKMALEFFRKKDLPLTIIRPAIVYGPGDSNSGMILKLIRLIKNRKFLMVGNGENRLHLIYIDDLIQAFLLTLKMPSQGKIYTVASKKPIKLKNLVSLIARELKVKILPLKIPIIFARLSGMIFEKIYPLFSQNEPIITKSKVETITTDSVYDISQTQKELKFHPRVDYPEGIKKTIVWYLKQWN